MCLPLDVFTRKERGNLVGLGELGPHFKVRGLPSLVLATVKRGTACFFPLPYFNTVSVPDSGPSAAPELQVVLEDLWKALGVIHWGHRLVGASLDFTLGRATSAAWLSLELGGKCLCGSKAKLRPGLAQSPLKLSPCSQGWPHHDSELRDFRLCGEWPEGPGQESPLNPNTSVEPLKTGVGRAAALSCPSCKGGGGPLLFILAQTWDRTRFWSAPCPTPTPKTGLEGKSVQWLILMRHRCHPLASFYGFSASSLAPLSWVAFYLIRFLLKCNIMQLC